MPYGKKKYKKVLDEWYNLLYTNEVFERTDQCGVLAQLGEHLPYKQRVTGSSPVGPTYFFGMEHKNKNMAE